MPGDKVTHGTEVVDGSRVRTGPRHAAPRKPLFTRFHVPAGKAIAIAAMPTAVLMGMGLTPTLAQADDHSTAKSLTADEYQACVEAVTGAADGKDASESASPTPSADASESPAEATPEPSASKEAKDAGGAKDSADKGTTSSPDSGSDDKAEPAASASSPAAVAPDARPTTPTRPPRRPSRRTRSTRWASATPSPTS